MTMEASAIMTMQQDAAPVGSSGPDFGTVTHPLFRHDWFLSGANRLFAAFDGSLQELSWNFWATYDYSDQVFMEKHSDISFRWKEDVQRPTQEEMDEVSAVRLMERRAGSVVDMLPIKIDGDDGEGGALLNGEATMRMTSDMIEFTLTERVDEDWTVIARSSWVDGKWSNETLLRIQSDGCMTDLVGRDYQRVLESSLDLATLGLTDMPTVVTAAIDDDGIVQFTLADDAFDSFVDANDEDSDDD